MRIAICSWSRRRVGGVEAYLHSVIPELQRLGHELAFFHEVDRPVNRQRIHFDSSVACWSVEDLGEEQALAALRAWRPSVIYAQGLLDPTIEELLIEIAPCVLFIHSYYGTCISGRKTLAFPIANALDNFN